MDINNIFDEQKRILEDPDSSDQEKERAYKIIKVMVPQLSRNTDIDLMRRKLNGTYDLPSKYDYIFPIEKDINKEIYTHLKDIPGFSKPGEPLNKEPLYHGLFGKIDEYSSNSTVGMIYSNRTNRTNRTKKVPKNLSDKEIIVVDLNSLGFEFDRTNFKYLLIGSALVEEDKFYGYRRVILYFDVKPGYRYTIKGSVIVRQRIYTTPDNISIPNYRSIYRDL